MRFIFLVILLLISCAFANEHRLTNFKGGDIELKAYDHAVAGSVRNFLIFATQNEETGISSFIAKKDGLLISAEIKKQSDGSFGTSFSYIAAGGETKNVSVELKKLDREENRYTFATNGQDVFVDVVADDFINNHFINPRYDFEIQGEKISVKMERGEACYNFSAHLIAFILTAYSL